GARAGIGGDARVDRRRRRGSDDEEAAFEVRLAVAPAQDLDVELEQLGLEPRRNDRHARTALEEAADLLESDLPAADDEGATPLEVEAGHVVALLSHRSALQEPRRRL